MNSRIINFCQTCNSKEFDEILNLGFLPSVNDFQSQDKPEREQLFFPTVLTKCKKCELVQLSCIVNKEILFPKSYPYTSSTTKVLRDNFDDLSSESRELLHLNKTSLVCDIGSNDGNLLSFFKDHTKVVGITPEEIGNVAIKRGIPTIIDYFSKSSCEKVIRQYGNPDLITATNVFAHIDYPLEVLDLINYLLDNKGVFAIEVHYLKSLIETNQYDTIYHEHMRYYSLKSLSYLLGLRGFKIFHAKLIPSHGGSIRVYSTKNNDYKDSGFFKKLLEEEEEYFNNAGQLSNYQFRVEDQRNNLVKMLTSLKLDGKKIVGIGAPSRGTTLVNYSGIQQSLISYICEVSGSHKIGNKMPGTSIPVIDESFIFQDQPDYALLLSWHIADDLIKILKKKGLKSKFIVPLPEPKIID